MMFAVLISPHFDDICFSLGGYLAQSCLQGCVINAFTDTFYLRHRPVASISPRVAATIRDKEDAQFVSSLGLQRHNLGLPDTSARGEPAFGLQDRRPMVKLLAQRLNEAVRRHYPQPGAVIFCPVGIGEHVDHLCTFEAVCLLQEGPWGSRQIFHYEELPYARYLWNRYRRLRALKALGKLTTSARLAYPLSEPTIARKQSRVRHYQSQVDANPLKCCKYIGALEHGHLSEILWVPSTALNGPQSLLESWKHAS